MSVFLEKARQAIVDLREVLPGRPSSKTRKLKTAYKRWNKTAANRLFNGA
jgi:hypothetical protein